MNYKPYRDYDIYDMINEPRRISKDPYKLHAAFMLSCLFEACPDDEDGNPVNPNNTWDWEIPKEILRSILKNGNEQFVDACNNDLPIDVWGKSYSIRHSNHIDPSKLNDIFSFKETETGYVISKNGIMDLSVNSHIDVLNVLQDNKTYLHKVVMVAEDDENNGWDKLTDMEVTMYLWYLYKQKYTNEDYPTFRAKYKEDIYTDEEEEVECWNKRSQIEKAPTGLYLFLAMKVREWNQIHMQHSIIDEVDTEKAEAAWSARNF